MDGMYKMIWDLALPYLDVRHGELHTKVAYGYARMLLDIEGGDEDVVLPAIILHDTGWKKVPKNIRDASFNGCHCDRKLHENESAKIASEILKKAGCGKEKSREIIDIIIGHDSRKQPLSKNDMVTKDADRLWRVSRDGFHIDVKRFGSSVKERCAALSKKIDSDLFYTETAKKIAIEELKKRKKE